MAATAAQQKTAAVEQEEGEHGPFPIEQLQVLYQNPSGILVPKCLPQARGFLRVSAPPPRIGRLLWVCLDLGSLLASCGVGLHSCWKFLIRFSPVPHPKWRAFLGVSVPLAGELMFQNWCCHLDLKVFLQILDHKSPPS